MKSHRNKNEEPPIQDDGTQPDPPPATQDEIDAVITQANAVDGEQPAATQPEAAKRKRRSALEMFADEKQERADAVARAELAVTQANEALKVAVAEQDHFLIRARAALGL